MLAFRPAALSASRAGVGAGVDYGLFRPLLVKDSVIAAVSRPLRNGVLQTTVKDGVATPRIGLVSTNEGSSCGVVSRKEVG